jgi:hypothetical protein
MWTFYCHLFDFLQILQADLKRGERKRERGNSDKKVFEWNFKTTSTSIEKLFYSRLTSIKFFEWKKCNKCNPTLFLFSPILKKQILIQRLATFYIPSRRWLYQHFLDSGMNFLGIFYFRKIMQMKFLGLAWLFWQLWKWTSCIKHSRVQRIVARLCIYKPKIPIWANFAGHMKWNY